LTAETARSAYHLLHHWPIDRRLEYLYNKEASGWGGGIVVHSVDFDDRISPLSRRLVPDDMWVLVQPLMPTPKVRPQGGGRTRVGDRAVFVAVVYVLTSGCAWRRLPVTFGIAVPTAYRRFVEWNGVRLWDRLYDSVHDVSGNGSGPDDHLVDWARSIRDAAEARAAFAS
jgi:transposase